jgi:hypothetical protein
VPKIDWLGDDYTRYEPRFRVARPRRQWMPHRDRDRDPRADYYAPPLSDLFQPLSAPLERKRRPLHLIWGEPIRDKPAS